MLQSRSDSSIGKALVGCGRLIVVGALSSLEPLARDELLRGLVAPGLRMFILVLIVASFRGRQRCDDSHRVQTVLDRR